MSDRALPDGKPAPLESPARSAPGAGLEELYARWDAVRARSGLESASAGSAPGRAAGFLRRTLRRIRDLGIAWDLQRDLLRALLDRQKAVEERLEDDVAARERLEQLVAGLEQRAQAIAGESGAASAAVAELRGGLGVARDGLGALREGQESLRARQFRLETGYAALDGRVVGQDALLRRLRRLRQAGSAAEEEPRPPVPLSPGTLTDLLRQLDGERRAGAVEVSIQDARAEDLLLAAQRWFGARMSSSGPVYRSPNDLWIHVDFTPDWRRPILLANAAARLGPEGRFLLVTAPGTEPPARHPDLTQVDDREIAEREELRVRCLEWRRPASATAPAPSPSP